ncbi:MAG: redoxin domain-containing protein [Bacteroidales bacterium]|nr:redoxin domain-containing protein [Bacteroidales bacterium]
MKYKFLHIKFMTEGAIIRNTILFIFVFLLPFGLNAQNLRIDGVGQGIGGKTIRLISISDNLSKLEKEEAVFRVGDEDSAFNFAISISNTSLIKIRIESFDYNFIAKMGSTYKLRILPFNFNISDKVNTLFYKFPLPIIIDSSIDNSLNEKVFVIDSVIEEYMVNNDRDILFYRDKKKVEKLINMVSSIVDSSDSDYIKEYLKYSIGMIEYSSKVNNEIKLKTELFFNKPILYENLAYMDCFEMVYGDYFTKGNKIFDKRTLERWLETNDYFSLIDSLGRDSLLRNEVFRELVFLRGMKEAFFSQLYNRSNIVNMLENFVYQSKFSQHILIAKNLLDTFFQQSTYGVKATDFTLKDIYNNYITLDKYKEKPLIISFVKVSEPACLRELNMMYSLVDTLSENFNFLTIACDKSLDALYNFLVNSNVGVKYKWDFVHFEGKWDLLKKYNIIVFPTFVMLDSKGVILQNPMRKPSEGSLLPYVPRPKPKDIEYVLPK